MEGMNMNETFTFTPEEREQTLLILDRLRAAIGDTFSKDDEQHLREDIHHAFENHQIRRDVLGLNPIQAQPNHRERELPQPAHLVL